MKKLSFLLLLLWHCSGQATAQDHWQKVSSGTGKDLLSVSFGNSSTGYIGGMDSTLLKTTDGGKTWTALEHTGIAYEPDTRDIIDITFVTANTGYAVLSNRSRPDVNGVLYKTTDGGHTWSVPATILMSAYRAFFFDENNGYLIGVAPFAGPTLSKANSGTWSTVKYLGTGTSYLATAIDFLDVATGIVGGDYGYVYRTFDKGLSWDTVKTNVDTTINALLYLDENTIVGMTNNTSATIIRSDDKGATWSFDPSSATFFYPMMKAVARSKTDSLIMVGHSVTTGKGIIYYFDPKDAWMNIYTSEQSLNSVRMRDDSIAFVVGDSGLILRNTLSKSVSVPETKELSQLLQLYPNPSSGQFHTLLPVPHSVAVYDLSGRLVYQRSEKAAAQDIDLSGNSCGTYLVAVTTTSGQTAYRTLTLQ